MCPRTAGFDEAPRRRQCWRACCALGDVTLDHDPPAEGTLPADGYGLWDVLGGHDCVWIGVVAAARHL